MMLFLLYSQYLTRYDDEDIPGGAGNKECHFELLMRERGDWWTSIFIYSGSKRKERL